MKFDRAICLILLSSLLSATIYGLASPFLPQTLEEKSVDTVWTGIIFSSMAVATILTSLFCGRIIDRIGHNRVIFFGCILMAGSIASFGLIEGMSNKRYIIGLAIVLRVCQGAAAGMINTAAYSFVS